VYATAIGHELGLEDEDLRILRNAAMLHDIGKIRVSSEILKKVGDLTEEDFFMLRLHSKIAIEVIEEFAFLTPCLPAITLHHERWDGNGYPNGLAGEHIPLSARIIHVAETYDILVNGSPWRNPLTVDIAYEEVCRHSGSQFDPKVVEALGKCRHRIQPLGT
jgi:HD-GYP domain-containing protein (c-di-GMP phosphodiesterase class II)